MRAKRKYLCGVGGAIVTGFVLCWLAGVTALAEERGVVVIANPSVPESSLDKTTLSKLFLKKKSTWSNGDPVVIVILDGGEVHRRFLDRHLGKTERQYASHWSKLVFTGTGRPPQSFADERRLVAHVASVPGAVGYVGTETDTTGVKRISVTE